MRSLEHDCVLVQMPKNGQLTDPRVPPDQTSTQKTKESPATANTPAGSGMHQPVEPGADSGGKLKFHFAGDKMKLSAPSADSAKDTVTPKHGRKSNN